jgi:restriction system protein
MVNALSGTAWLFSGFFFVLSAVCFGIQKMSAAKVVALGNPPDFGRTPSSQWKPPAWAPKGPPARQEPIDIASGIAERLSTDDAGRSEILTKPTEWSLDLIRQIEWKRFEDVCQRFYECKGIRSETTPLGPDGGIDIRLYQDDIGKATSVVQCKAWGERFVGVKPVRELLGVMAHEKLEKGFFMTSGRYSDDAKEFAKSNRITLIDGQMLLMMIQRLPADAQGALLSFATEGDYTIPTCPGCGTKMRSVPGTAGRPDFWGCPTYPKCRQKLGKRRAV